MQPLLNIATRAALNAGKIIAQNLDYVDTIQRYSKGNKDFATKVDNLAEQEIINLIKKSYPMHSILAEESGAEFNQNPDFLWIIDPLDGTLNFANQHPDFAVSIAVQIKGRIEHAVIYDPLRQELYTATRGEGAKLNNRRLRMKKQVVGELHNAIIGTVLPRNYPEVIPYYLKIFNQLIPNITDFRCTGSSALDLAYVADGRLDAYFGMSSKIWDLAAGVLLVQESGGIAFDFMGENNYLETGNLIVGNPRLAKALLNLVKSAI